MVSLITKRYWVSAAKELMEMRLPPPQYDEFCAAMDELLQVEEKKDAQSDKKNFETWFDGWLQRHQAEINDLQKRAMWDAWQKAGRQFGAKQ